MLKAVELNREVTIAQFQEELERLRVCVAQRDSLEKELLAHKADKVVEVSHFVTGNTEIKALKYEYSLYAFRQSWPVCASNSVRLRSNYRPPDSRPPYSLQSSVTPPAPVTTP